MTTIITIRKTTKTIIITATIIIKIIIVGTHIIMCTFRK